MKPDMTTAQFREQFVKEWTEEAFQEHVIALARVFGWRVAHFRPVRIQRANGTTHYETPVAADGKGWPDLVLVKDRVIYAELKRENGVLEPAQRDWRDLLLAAGATHRTWRPRDLGAIEAELRG